MKAHIIRFIPPYPYYAGIRKPVLGGNLHDSAGAYLVKDFDAFCSWLKNQLEGELCGWVPYKLTDPQRGIWMAVKADGCQFKWDGHFLTINAISLIPTEGSQKDDVCQGILMYEAWKALKIHMDFVHGSAVRIADAIRRIDSEL